MDPSWDLYVYIDIIRCTLNMVYKHAWRIIPFSRWLITMVRFRPLTGVPPPSKWPFTSWLINGGDPNHLHSLKLTANAPENRPKRPKRKRPRNPTIHFQVQLLLVSGRVLTGMILQVVFHLFFVFFPGSKVRISQNAIQRIPI